MNNNENKLPSKKQRKKDESNETLALLKEVPNGTHVTATDLFELATSKGVPISISTIYRQLAALEASGAILGVGTVSARGRAYEITPSEKHYHLICMDCRRTVEFFDPVLSQFGESMATRAGYEFHDSRFDLFGFCQDCRQKDDTPSQEEVFEDLQRLSSSFEQELGGLRNKKHKASSNTLDTKKNKLAEIVNEFARLLATLKS
jgi:Fur family transcriptional regulator, ferric uptake regulator